GPRVLLEITMNSLTGKEGQVDNEDFLHRVDTLSALGFEVLVSNFKYFYQMKFFLRQCTDQAIGIVVGAPLLDKLFEESFYQDLPGGILDGMGRLFDSRTRMFVYPFKDDKQCMTAATFQPPAKLQHLFKHLVATESVI